jgi:hypothetical protein
MKLKTLVVAFALALAAPAMADPSNEVLRAARGEFCAELAATHETPNGEPMDQIIADVYKQQARDTARFAAQQGISPQDAQAAERAANDHGSWFECQNDEAVPLDEEHKPEKPLPGAAPQDLP